MKLPSPRRCILASLALLLPFSAAAEEMDKMWGESVVKLRADDAKRGQLFEDGNYAMFIHWGLYSQLGNKVNGKTYYGIGEWIMNTAMAGIPVAEYKELADTFNPDKFDAKAIAQLAKDAGMKYIVITSKHHDGFAMYDSKSNDFNIVDATPFKHDPDEGPRQGLQGRGHRFRILLLPQSGLDLPRRRTTARPRMPNGKPANFDDYFAKKCLPQVKEITSRIRPDRNRLVRHAGQDAEEIRRATGGRRAQEPAQRHDLRPRRPWTWRLPVARRHGGARCERARASGKPWTPPTIPGPTPGMTRTGKRHATILATPDFHRRPRRHLHAQHRPARRRLRAENARTTLRTSGEWIRRHPQVVYGTESLAMEARTAVG